MNSVSRLALRSNSIDAKARYNKKATNVFFVVVVLGVLWVYCWGGVAPSKSSLLHVESMPDSALMSSELHISGLELFLTCAWRKFFMAVFSRVQSAKREGMSLVSTIE